MNLLEYLETKPEQFIPGKEVAQALGVVERDLRGNDGLVKNLNRYLLSIGAKMMVVSNNSKPIGYCYTGDPQKIHRYFLQNRSLAKGIYDNCIIARAMEKRIADKLKQLSPPIIEEGGQVRLSL